MLSVLLGGCDGTVADEVIDGGSDDTDNNINQTVYNQNIGDSIKFVGVNYTFLNSYWAERMSGGYKIYTIDISARNI